MTVVNESMQPLRLVPMGGPPIQPIVMNPAESPVVIGRSGQCNFVLKDPDETVSRRHAEFTVSGDQWTIRDLGSKHGTVVNGFRITSEQPVLRTNDRVKIGPWPFRVIVGSEPLTTDILTLSDDRQSTEQQVQRVAVGPAQGAAQKRLDLIVKCAADMVTAEDEAALAGIALDALAAETGLPRAALIRVESESDQVQIIASRGTEPGRAPVFSRTLLHAAATGETVVLNIGQGMHGSGPTYGQSIMSQGITTAVCAPIMIDDTPNAYIYLDARQVSTTGGRPPAPVSSETVEFCRTISRLCGLAMANLHRRRLEVDERRQRTEFEAAREVQRMIMPPPAGAFGPVSYTMFSRPGRRVAGDLFDFFPVGTGGRFAVLIGDVEGKGVGAGMVMANVQAHLSRLLREIEHPETSIAAAIAEVSHIVAGFVTRADGRGRHAPTFLTLWAGIIDPARRRLTFVDAGHGHFLVRTSDGRVEVPEIEHAAPLGVEPDAGYISHSIDFVPGSRLILYTDGLTEQFSPLGEQFGKTRAMTILGTSADAARDVESLINALRSHAGLTRSDTTMSFNDDVTIASVALGG